MFDFFDDWKHSPGLLVSVRSADEARVAIAGGAEVIDVKEPNRGSLGAADPHVVGAVVAAVGSCVPVSAAAGELLDGAEWCDGKTNLLKGVSYAKFGLAGCEDLRDWTMRWRSVISRLPKHVQVVAVAYADWQEANAPPPDEVLTAAQALGCPAMLVDTWDKSAGPLFHHWPAEGVRRFCQRTRAARIGVALAGSLTSADVAAAIHCGPQLIAVRGAVCDGGRGGQLSLTRIRVLRAALRGGTTRVPVH